MSVVVSLKMFRVIVGMLLLTHFFLLKVLLAAQLVALTRKEERFNFKEGANGLNAWYESRNLNGSTIVWVAYS